MKKIYTKTVNKDLQRLLTGGSTPIELITECRLILKELREYPEENKNQIKYYEKLWIELSHK